MKLAIVGTSIDLTENEERDIRQIIGIILNECTKDSIIISGGAKGVDSMVFEIATALGFKTEIYPPKQQGWEFFKERNLKIAKECDKLYCITVPVHNFQCYHHEGLQKHEKTAGCWTLKKVEDLGKPCKLLVTLNR